MAWANQLWKQYDPINNIIFPKMGAWPTYDDRGACATDVDRERDDPTHADEGTYENETTDSTLFEANNERREKSSRNDASWDATGGQATSTCPFERTGGLFLSMTAPVTFFY